MALASLAYLTGSGFSVGAHTIVTATTFKLDQLPAIPMLGGLPTGRHPFLAVGIIFWPFLFGAIYYVITRVHETYSEKNKDLLRTFIMGTFFVWELTYFASGELLTPSMRRTGVLPERTTTIAALSAAVIALVFFYLPKLMKKYVKHD
jgi:hypothetical protein